MCIVWRAGVCVGSQCGTCVPVLLCARVRPDVRNLAAACRAPELVTLWLWRPALVTHGSAWLSIAQRAAALHCTSCCGFGHTLSTFSPVLS